MRSRKVDRVADRSGNGNGNRTTNLEKQKFSFVCSSRTRPENPGKLELLINVLTLDKHTEREQIFAEKSTKMGGPSASERASEQADALDSNVQTTYKQILIIKTNRPLAPLSSAGCRFCEPVVS